MSSTGLGRGAEAGMQTTRTDVEKSQVENVPKKRKLCIPQNIYELSNPGQLFMLQERERGVLEIFRGMDCDILRAGRILEVGCGSGVWIRDLIRWGAPPHNITGVELLPERAAVARRLSPDGVCVHCGDARVLGFPDCTFDMVIQSTVFTSILNEDVRRQLAQEMLRVLKPTGLILWYDFHVNNPRNPDVRGVAKREIHGLFKGCKIELRRITLAPPITRILAPLSWWACQFFSLIPVLCTHYLGTIRKPLHHE